MIAPMGSAWSVTVHYEPIIDPDRVPPHDARQGPDLADALARAAHARTLVVPAATAHEALRIAEARLFLVTLGLGEWRLVGAEVRPASERPEPARNPGARRSQGRRPGRRRARSARADNGSRE
jgi:hypothetical protein